MHSVFSKVAVYISHQEIYDFNRLYAHKSYILIIFKEKISEYKNVLPCHGYDYEKDPDDLHGAPMSDLFFQKKNATA